MDRQVCSTAVSRKKVGDVPTQGRALMTLPVEDLNPRDPRLGPRTVSSLNLGLVRKTGNGRHDRLKHTRTLLLDQALTELHFGCIALVVAGLQLEHAPQDFRKRL